MAPLARLSCLRGRKGAYLEVNFGNITCLRALPYAHF